LIPFTTIISDMVAIDARGIHSAVSLIAAIAAHPHQDLGGTGLERDTRLVKMSRPSALKEAQLTWPPGGILRI
jgi:hypothetical protein